MKPPEHRSAVVSCAAVARDRIVEHDGREGVTETFTESDARIELVADAVRAADVVGAREVEFDVVAEFVRDDVLVEFVGVRGEVGQQRDVLRVPAVKNVPVVWLPQSTISTGKLVVGATPRTVWMPWYTVSRIANGAEARVPVAAPAALMPVGIATLCAVPALELKLTASVKV